LLLPSRKPSAFRLLSHVFLLAASLPSITIPALHNNKLSNSRPENTAFYIHMLVSEFVAQFARQAEPGPSINWFLFFPAASTAHAFHKLRYLVMALTNRCSDGVVDGYRGPRCVLIGQSLDRRDRGIVRSLCLTSFLQAAAITSYFAHLPACPCAPTMLGLLTHLETERAACNNDGGEVQPSYSWLSRLDNPAECQIIVRLKRVEIAGY
jgi:hypothetical protein